jgi:hypothetical protein
LNDKYTEERLLSLKGKTNSTKYGLNLILKYPEKFKFFPDHILYGLKYEKKILDDIENANEEDIAKLKEILSLYNFNIISLTEFEISLEFYRGLKSNVIKKNIINIIEKLIRSPLFDNEINVSFSLLRIFQRLNICIKEKCDNSKKFRLSIYDFDDDVIEKLLLLNASTVHNRIIEEFIEFDESFYMNNYDKINILNINLNINPWANPWRASDGLKLFIILNDLDRKN